MSTFHPTRPPPGRLARLGVIVDATQPDWLKVATLCDRAGLGAVWLAEQVGPADSSRSDDLDATTTRWSTDLWKQVRALVGNLSLAAVGVIGSRPSAGGGAAALADVAANAALSAVAGLELCIDVGEYAGELAPVLRRKLGGGKSGQPIRLSAVLNSATAVEDIHPFVDDVCLSGWAFPDLEAAVDETRAKAVDLGRDPATLGVAVILPVSIGRTEGEASARADRDPLFARLGHPRDIGIFGTLEECQDRVIALAHAGVTDLRLILPTAPDIHDVIAQLTAMTIGTTDVLIPGALRSPAPPPPPGWGGRPDRPPTPRVSGGPKRC